MTKRMLVDAAYPEETRVVVADNETLLDFDFETASKRQLKGNIYLAKVVRVEPSLQAAFVEYGGNRHGFLAFSEIHPDYYQIPQADREKLAELESQLVQAQGDEDDESDADEEGEGTSDTINADQESSDVVTQLRRERAKLLRSYKIQEVVRRRQIMLVQVMKEERGTKGAALTTYLSLAGRYCVLMPNTPKGGGISRKIATAADRSRLKKIASELEVPEGMGLIIRTAGQERTKVEIRRDYEYLLRLWNDIRERTLSSVAPCPIYEEADLIRRAMRDLYTNDIEEILVEGEAGYRTAKTFMTMLMPSRARRVKQYRADTPLFFAHKVEDQLDKMHNATVHLRSGGSIVIHTTEALTAIDVNSGRATRERHIDETAVKTNLEAADEIARQLRLRDIAGLVVIDFIDMSEHRHQRQVEKRFRDALKLDRARLQVGRISTFGLLELSRQRLRPSFLELSTQPCTVCHGTGFIRSTESAALQALRRVEAIGVDGKASRVAMTLPLEVAMYLLNQKRQEVQRIEGRYGIEVLVRVEETLVASEFRVEVLEAERAAEPAEPAETVAEPVAREEPEDTEEQPAAADSADEGGKRKRRRRRRPRRRSEAEGSEGESEQQFAADAEAEFPHEPEPAETPVAVASPGDSAESDGDAVSAAAAATDEAAAAETPATDEKPKRRRRRRKPASEERPAEHVESVPAAAEVVAEGAVDVAPAEGATELVLPPVPEVDPSSEFADIPDAEAVEVTRAEPEPDAAPQLEPATASGEAGKANGQTTEDEAEPSMEERPGVVVQDASEASQQPRRQGWWSRWTRGDGA